MSYEPPINDDVFELDDEDQEDEDMLSELLGDGGEPDRMWGDE